MAQLKISISFSKESEDVYNFLKSQGNVSRFVCDVVRERVAGRVELEKRVEKIVAKMITGRPTTIKDDSLEKASDCFDF